MMREIEQRAQSLSGVLSAPINEDDRAEEKRRAELRMFVLSLRVYRVNRLIPSRRKLEGVIAKLEPLSEQHALVKFLRNVNNTKLLTGSIQELSDAITDYQVWVPSPNMIFD